MNQNQFRLDSGIITIMKFLKKIVDGTPGASPLCLKMVKQGEMCHFMKVSLMLYMNF